MRIAFVLVLLLTASAYPAWSQNAQAQSTLPALPVLPDRLTPDATASTSPVSLDLRRDHAAGAMIGAITGLIAGGLVANLLVCTEPGGEGDAQGICKAAGMGLGTIVGAITGAIIGVPVRTSGR